MPEETLPEQPHEERETLRARVAQLEQELRELRTALGEQAPAGGARSVDAVLASVSDAFFALDRAWRFTYLNNRAVAVLQRTREELLGRNVWEAFPPAVGTAFDREYHRAVATGQPTTFEAFYEPLGIWFEVRAYPSPDGLAVYFLDVTERRRAGRELAESEARFRRLIEQGAVGLDIGDATGRLTYVNGALLAILGYRRADVDPPTGTPLRRDALTPADWRAVDEAALRELLEHGCVAPYEKEYFGRDGRRVPVIVGPAVLRRQPDGSIELAEFVVDLTKRRQAEEALRESEARFHALADQIPQQAWMADPDGRVTWFNQQWVSFTGIDVEDTQRPDWQTGLYHPNHERRVLETFQQSLARGEAWEATFPIRNRAGEYRWFLSRAVPIREEDGRITRWFGTNTDVTVQLQAEEGLRRAKEQAERANLAKAEFLAAMSHDLRTPLNAIIGYVELLGIGIHGAVTDAQSSALNRIRVNGEHLLTLIGDILNFARVEAGRLTYDLMEIRAGALVGSLTPLVVPQIESRRLVYECEAVPPELAIVADADRARQILLNLIGNATKFTQPGGRIRVSCEGDAETVRFHVSDTGPGIPSDLLEHIFEPFVQLESSRVEGAHRGFGLGLAISLDLARAMGGDVTVESTLGVGSAFTLSLPRSTGGVSARLASGERRRRGERRTDPT